MSVNRLLSDALERIAELEEQEKEKNERISKLEKALSDLIERAAQRDSWKYFPESYLDEAFKVLLKKQGK